MSHGAVFNYILSSIFAYNHYLRLLVCMYIFFCALIKEQRLNPSETLFKQWKLKTAILRLWAFLWFSTVCIICLEFWFLIKSFIRSVTWTIAEHRWTSRILRRTLSMVPPMKEGETKWGLRLWHWLAAGGLPPDLHSSHSTPVPSFGLQGRVWYG